MFQHRVVPHHHEKIKIIYRIGLRWIIDMNEQKDNIMEFKDLS